MTRLRKFSTSNGCQDHTTSPFASAPSVSTPEFAHGVDPALRSLARPALPRPPHPAPNVCDDRETPLRGNGTAGDIDLIWANREAEYFCKRGWTGNR
jgi:hypothetical protein